MQSTWVVVNDVDGSGDGVVVGFLTGFTREQDFYVEIVATSKDYMAAKKIDRTRIGVGLMLVKAAMEEAKAMHGLAVAACIRTSNIGSYRLFAKAAEQSKRLFSRMEDEDDVHEDVELSVEEEAHFDKVEREQGRLVSYTMPLK